MRLSLSPKVSPNSEQGEYKVNTMLTAEKSSVTISQNQEKLQRGHSITATVYAELAIVLMCSNGVVAPIGMRTGELFDVLPSVNKWD